MLEWEAVNNQALTTVNSAETGVTLVYAFAPADPVISAKLGELVAAEQDCCGAAGVSFSLTRTPVGAEVTINVVRMGLPARTVVEAFGNMTPGRTNL